MTLNGFKINNLPNNIQDKRYVVARLVEDELWYYGAYDSEEKATQITRNLEGGVLVPIREER